MGVFYYKQRWYPGAIDRLKALLKDDPGFTGRDGAYYYLAEALVKVRLNAEALPYYEKLIAEFDDSEYLAAGQAAPRRVARAARREACRPGHTRVDASRHHAGAPADSAADAIGEPAEAKLANPFLTVS